MTSLWGATTFATLKPTALMRIWCSMACRRSFQKGEMQWHDGMAECRGQVYNTGGAVHTEMVSPVTRWREKSAYTPSLSMESMMLRSSLCRSSLRCRPATSSACAASAFHSGVSAMVLLPALPSGFECTCVALAGGGAVRTAVACMHSVDDVFTRVRGTGGCCGYALEVGSLFAHVPIRFSEASHAECLNL